MTTTYSPTQTASCISGLVNTTTASFNLNGTALLSPYTCALYRFQLPSANIYFHYPLTLSLDFGGIFVGTSQTFNVLLLLDASALPTLVTGQLAASQVPSGAWPLGTAEHLEVGTVTLTDFSTTTVITLDLAMVTRIMSASLSYSNAWAGSLLFWVTAEQDSSDSTLSTAATLTAYDTITYTNRDTGSRGINSSRWDRCPVTGLKIPHDEMVIDGFRNIRVHPKAYDEPEPEAREWGDDNESDSENN